VDPDNHEARVVLILLLTDQTLREAMPWYEKEEAVRPPADDDAILRWNTSVRTIARRGFTSPPDESRQFPLMLE